MGVLAYRLRAVPQLEAAGMTPPKRAAVEQSPLCKCGCGGRPDVGAENRTLKFARGHQAIMMERISAANFWARVDKRGRDECWPWLGSINKEGYGVVTWHDRSTPASRLAYILSTGTTPSGMDVDHQCHNRDSNCPGGADCPHRRCCNPAHLEAVPTAVNVLRGVGLTAQNAAKTECIRGHPFDEVNTQITSDGRRECRECDRERRAKHNERRRQASRLRREGASA